ncbi:MAG TPA: hypothetical protein VGZ32_13175 [Actinocrinis sp.]|uniref:hypothetical protein n=1 Tax=Actinocrinis sp. TaxID=1920516 RepID=UPI002DDDB125|nr:hypothetical protein [Actinocrinis sp.]HEV3171295.1 hypothetical protein [Actinocrinis sp.]
MYRTADAPRRTASTRGRGGADGNERLTAITGVVLLVLFAAEGVTLLQLRGLLYWHYFIGLLLIGPVCVKIASTAYRFTRYYTRHPEYVRKGPPAPLLRLLGPFVILTSVGVLGTGVALGLAGTRTYAGVPILLLHKASFVLWAAVMTAHVLAYVWRLPALVGADLRSSRGRRAMGAIGGRGLRWSITAVGLGGGLVAAMAGAHLAAHWSWFR